MVDKNNRRIKQSLLANQKGQAVFELVIFMPLLLFLYTIYYTAGNSINGSINQQKAVRGYFYSLNKGNSYINTPADLAELVKNPDEGVGFSAIGWRESSDAVGKKVMGPCFKFSSLLKNDSTETCESSDREEDGKSRYIRVFTVYGVCGPYFQKSQTQPVFLIKPEKQNSIASCTQL